VEEGVGDIPEPESVGVITHSSSISKLLFHKQSEAAKSLHFLESHLGLGVLAATKLSM